MKTKNESENQNTAATPNDPKLSDWPGWRDCCAEAERRWRKAAGVTAGPVRCSAWLGVIRVALVLWCLSLHYRSILACLCTATNQAAGMTEPRSEAYLETEKCRHLLVELRAMLVARLQTGERTDARHRSEHQASPDTARNRHTGLAPSESILALGRPRVLGSGSLHEATWSEPALLEELSRLGTTREEFASWIECGLSQADALTLATNWHNWRSVPRGPNLVGRVLALASSGGNSGGAL